MSEYTACFKSVLVGKSLILKTIPTLLLPIHNMISPKSNIQWPYSLNHIDIKTNWILFKKLFDISFKFICYQDYRHERSSEMLFHPQKFGKELPAGLVWISWESCLIRCLLQFQKIFTFRSPDDMWVQSVSGTFWRDVTWIYESIPWHLVTQELVSTI